LRDFGRGVASDQQAALFGQAGFERGAAKSSYGPGSFILLDTGKCPAPPDSGLISIIAWILDAKVTYALEGSMFIG